jgi:hypothetical protein
MTIVEKTDIVFAVHFFSFTKTMWNDQSSYFNKKFIDMVQYTCAWLVTLFVYTGKSYYHQNNQFINNTKMGNWEIYGTSDLKIILDLRVYIELGQFQMDLKKDKKMIKNHVSFLLNFY